MELYFVKFYSIVSAILIISVLIYIGETIIKRNEITSWGKRIVALTLLGFFICVFAALRDGYVLSVQASANSNITPGLFTTDSIQSSLACLGGAVIGFSSISSIFVRRQGYRKTMFFILSAVIVFKTLLIEISRIIL